MISLADAKANLHIDTDYDDAVIERLIAAAGDHLKSIGVNMDADPLPPAVVQAQMLLIGHFYGHMEATTSGTNQAIEFGVDCLIAPYREQGL